MLFSLIEPPFTEIIMPTNDLTPSHTDKSTPRSGDGSKSLELGALATDHTTSVSAGQSRSVSSQVAAGASSAKQKASDLAHDAKSAASHLSGEQVGEVARNAISSAKAAVEHVKDESSTLLHDAREVASESYQSAREYALDTAHDARELAQRTGRQVGTYVRRSSAGTVRFFGTHALPLSAVGLGLGWLAWSIRNDLRARRYETTPVPTRLSATLETRRPPARSEDALRYEARYEEPYRTRDLPLTGATSTGQKLMGVRVRDGGYEG